MEDLDLEAEFGGIAADAFVVFRQCHRAEDLGLHLSPHIHSGAVDYQHSRHFLLLALLKGELVMAQVTGGLEVVTSREHTPRRNVDRLRRWRGCGLRYPLLLRFWLF